MKYLISSIAVLVLFAPVAGAYMFKNVSLFRRPTLLAPPRIREMIEEQNAVIESFNKAFEKDAPFSPPCEVSETDEAFQVSLDVPGVKASDIDVTIVDNVLKVQAHRETENSKFNLYQSFTVDNPVDIDKLSATLDNGVLVVTAPKDMKKLDEEVRKIPVDVGGG